MKIGILGGGQLGRMLVLSGYPLGLEFRVFEPNPGAPAAAIAPTVVGSFTDTVALERFARDVDVVTYELEHLPHEAVAAVAAHRPVFPPPRALEVGQDRLREKETFRSLGITTPRYAPIRCAADVPTAVEHVGLPAIVKTTLLGYDGKGQRRIKSAAEGVTAWRDLGERTLIAEEFIPFEREVSIIAVRDRTGDIRFYPLVQNTHVHGILIRSDAPAPERAPELQREAEELCRRLLIELNYVGVLTIEFFVRDGHLVANEMAPRVHNSGHWTIEGATTSQFENHIRAVADLPLGSTEVSDAWTLFNLIGGDPALRSLASIPGAHPHLYGKTSRPGRKIGHVTVPRREAPSVALAIANDLGEV